MKFKKIHPWYRTRGYLHFDRPISFDNAKKIVTSPKKVSTHSFYPFINYSVDSKKIKKDKTSGTIETKHKQRPISYSSHVDSHIYSYYSYLLAKLYEKELNDRQLDDVVLAFRSLGKSNIEFAKDAFLSIKEFGECSVVALDLTKFFDTLDHNILKSQWANLISQKSLPPDHYNVFKSLTKFSNIDRSKLYEFLDISANNPKNCRVRICDPLEFRKKVRGAGLISQNQKKCGIPQGSPISALLSNIYMLDFDSDMKKYVDKFSGKYFRYCDDMLFVVPISEKNNVEEFAKRAIKGLEVTINVDKTESRTFKFVKGKLTADRSLQYLGFLFDGVNVCLRSASIARYYERMRKGVYLAKATMKKRNKLRRKRGETPKELFKKKLYQKYSHLGSRNFITYGIRAADVMDSKTIRRQLKPLWEKLQEQMKSR